MSPFVILLIWLNGQIQPPIEFKTQQQCMEAAEYINENTPPGIGAGCVQHGSVS